MRDLTTDSIVAEQANAKKRARRQGRARLVSLVV